MSDTLAAVHSDAGVVVGSETRHLLPIATDVAIVDSQTGGTDAEL
jgi:hypothetical protein